MGVVRVAARPSSVAAVRSTLRGDLAMLPEPVREDVALVASELLGNAMRHGSSLADGQLAISWEVDAAGVEIAVTDGGGPTEPTVEEPAPTEIGGRGLSIVATLSAQWGVERHGTETTVWALIPMLSPRLAPA
ncbi:MAG: ATP-binding protein [Acidothermaceae bacterium]